LKIGLDHRVQAQEAAMISAMMSKTQQIREALAVDDPIGALRIAAHFFDRSDDTMTFKRGMDAYNHPGFYRQLGQEPDQIIAAALRRLAEKFDVDCVQPVGGDDKRMSGAALRGWIRLSAPASLVQRAPGVENTSNHKD
jgi:hypothetical protein